MKITAEVADTLRRAISRERLIDTAVRLVEVPSPTGAAGPAADRLAEILTADGFLVERPVANWPAAPAVVARFDSGRPGRVLQFNGHLDTVHLPFVPPRVADGKLSGSGAVDMKGGIAAMVEAARVLRETRLLSAGSLLMTAHDLHEAPWGDNHQLEALIDAGFIGDAVLIPEYFRDCLPTVGRGLAILRVVIRREGDPVHEVLGGIDRPNVIAAGAELVALLTQLDARVALRSHPLAGRESVFIGRMASGEIYNQSPVQCEVEGTRRWLPGTEFRDVQAELQAIFDSVARKFGTTVDARLDVVRPAFEMAADNPLVAPFQQAISSVRGRSLPLGAKPFVDDGNTFVTRGKIPAITFGPGGRGAHTLQEEVPVSGLEETSLIYALAAMGFC